MTTTSNNRASSVLATAALLMKSAQQLNPGAPQEDLNARVSSALKSIAYGSKATLDEEMACCVAVAGLPINNKGGAK